jgi:lipid IVA palmitoyltransferase
LTRKGVQVRTHRFWSLAAAVAAFHAGPALAVECHGDPDSTELPFLDRACSRIVATWKEGKQEIILSGFAWHLPFTWTAERRAELNQNAWGGGYARTVEEPNGNTHSVFGLAFLDSHKNVECQVGYGWSAFWGPRDGLQPGLGYTAMIVQRPDIWNGIPFPAILPLVSLRYGNATLISTYIPTIGGGVNHGSVLYVLGRVTID